MNLRRCGGCKNQVGAESPICPICGLTPKEILLRRITRWIVIVLLVCVIWISLAHC